MVPGFQQPRKRPAAALRAGHVDEDNTHADIDDESHRVLRRPATWNEWADREEPDHSGLTPQQRHVLEKGWAIVPHDIKGEISKLKESKERGKQKKLNAVMNSLVPKNAKYSDDLVIDAWTYRRFRKVMKTVETGEQEIGFTYTEMLAKMHNSPALLDSGLVRGDIIKKMYKGREMYYLFRVVALSPWKSLMETCVLTLLTCV